MAATTTTAPRRTEEPDGRVHDPRRPAPGAFPAAAGATRPLAPSLAPTPEHEADDADLRGGYTAAALLLIGVAAVLDAYAWLGLLGRGSAGGLTHGNIAPVVVALGLLGGAAALRLSAGLGPLPGRALTATAGLVAVATLGHLALGALGGLVAVADVLLAAAVALSLAAGRASHPSGRQRVGRALLPLRTPDRRHPR